MPTTFEIWGTGYPSQEVVGESFYESALQKLVAGFEGDDEIIPVTLTHTPRNKHDSNAIAVMSSAGQVGSIPSADAARFAPYFRKLQNEGISLTTTARVWGIFYTDQWNGDTSFRSSVRVDLPEPHLLHPVNQPPTAAYRLLPRGGAIQVTGEEEFTDTLTAYLVPEGECWAYATLHPTETGIRVKKRVVEVRLDGQPVGLLSPKMSSDLLPAVDYLDEHGTVTTARALVKGNRLRVEVVLYAARAYELPERWLERVEQAAGAEAATVIPESETDTVAVETETPTVTAPEPVAPKVFPADWYPDPLRRARLRYYDGEKWSDHTAP